MDINQYKDVIENAEGRALATVGEDGVNVVALSMARVHDGKVCAFNFFMDKTAANVQQNPKVALSCWQGLNGIQVKGTVEYITEGEHFDEAVEWVKGQNPDRVVKGLIVLTPEVIFDLSAGANAGAKLA